MAYLSTCIDRYWKESTTIKSPWVENYSNVSPVACIMYYFSVKNTYRSLRLGNAADYTRFHKFLAMDMRIAKMSVTNLHDICKFFQIHIVLHYLDGYVDKYGVKQVQEPIEVIHLIFDHDRFIIKDQCQIPKMARA